MVTLHLYDCAYVYLSLFFIPYKTSVSVLFTPQRITHAITLSGKIASKSEFTPLTWKRALWRRTRTPLSPPSRVPRQPVIFLG